MGDRIPIEAMGYSEEAAKRVLDREGQDLTLAVRDLLPKFPALAVLEAVVGEAVMFSGFTAARIVGTMVSPEVLQSVNNLTSFLLGTSEGMVAVAAVFVAGVGGALITHSAFEITSLVGRLQRGYAAALANNKENTDKPIE